MSKQHKNIRRLSVLIYSLGLFIGLVVGAMSIWADLEASLFSSAPIAEKHLRSLSCPILMTAAESEATITAHIKNPAERDKIILVDANFSDGYISLIREEKLRLELSPGENRKLTWTVTPDDAVWDRIIMVRITSGRTYPVPARTGTCGILLLNIPYLSGGVIVTILVILSFAGVGGGSALWRFRVARTPEDHYAFKGMGLIAILLVAGIFLSFFDSWLSGGAILLMALIVILTVMGWALTRD